METNDVMAEQGSARQLQGEVKKKKGWGVLGGEGNNTAQEIYQIYILYEISKLGQCV